MQVVVIHITISRISEKVPNIGWQIAAYNGPNVSLLTSSALLRLILDFFLCVCAIPENTVDNIKGKTRSFFNKYIERIMGN